MAQVKTNKKQVSEVKKIEVKNQNDQVVEDLQKQVLALEEKQKNKIENLKKRVEANKSLQVINNYIKENTNFTLKPCNNEFHKIFVKYNQKNCMFLLIKSNNMVTLYTKSRIDELQGIENNTYPKQYPHRTTFKADDLTSEFLTYVFDKAIKDMPIKAEKATIAELKAKIAELQANQKQ